MKYEVIFDDAIYSGSINAYHDGVIDLWLNFLSMSRYFTSSVRFHVSLQQGIKHDVVHRVPR